FGIVLREFTFGHTKQLASAARAHLVALAGRTEVLAGAEQRVLVDIDSVFAPGLRTRQAGCQFRAHQDRRGSRSCVAVCRH
ncbi:MAG: IS1380 family transposase, partial [Pseudonocardiales bacterium]|nr:IS1380 family transposase [Pseudonocardiales bacterium]